MISSFTTERLRARADALQQCWMEKAETFLTRSTAQKYILKNPSGGTTVRFELEQKSVSESLPAWRAEALIGPRQKFAKFD